MLERVTVGVVVFSGVAGLVFSVPVSFPSSLTLGVHEAKPKIIAAERIAAVILIIFIFLFPLFRNVKLLTYQIRLFL